jgi:hypothetical protein
VNLFPRKNKENRIKSVFFIVLLAKWFISTATTHYYGPLVLERAAAGPDHPLQPGHLVPQRRYGDQHDHDRDVGEDDQPVPDAVAADADGGHLVAAPALLVPALALAPAAGRAAADGRGGVPARQALAAVAALAQTHKGRMGTAR